MLKGDKSPGPDGFPIISLRKCWDFIKEDIMKVVDEFQHECFLDWRLNNTFIRLIPKVDCVEDVGDFRPISLLSSVYKIITKVLASRLKGVLGGIISNTQNSFIKGRQIIDCCLIANELIDSKKKQGGGGMVVKADMTKAFDPVSWNFLEWVLIKMRFGSKWRKWIRICISNARFSILLNGSPKGFFKSFRGLRQGDPLSPFLFIMVTEVLSKMTKLLVDQGELDGFKVSNEEGGIVVSHLQFADDTMFFLEASVEKAKALRGKEL
ncbi:hypothetical protein ACHQM5_005739 [Ranunculus cassubicifolius]